LRAKRHDSAISQFRARPILIAYSTALSLTTGRVPGRPRLTGVIAVFGSAAKMFGAPSNILVAVPSSTCTSMPSTGS
jgi:hypothetical protein